MKPLTILPLLLAACTPGQSGEDAFDRAVAHNLAVPGVFSTTEVDSILAHERGRPTSRRAGDWALRFADADVRGYCFGLAEGGYAAEGRLAAGPRHDCISFVYRVTELARAGAAADAWRVALRTRFAGAPVDSVVDADGRVDYDHPAHLDYSVDMVRSGHWGRDVTATLDGARPDPVGSARYAPGTVTVAPEAALDPADLQHGDVVWFVLSPDDPSAAALRRDHGLMVGHAGVVARRDGRVWLVHAASKPLPGWDDEPGVVAVPLVEYLRRVDRYDGLIVTRFAGP